MADRGDTHYHVLKLNRWFLVSSGLLLLSVLWMVVDDAQRPWKDYQREFRRIEIARTEELLSSPQYQEMAGAEESLRAALQGAVVEQERHQADLARLADELTAAEGERFKVTEKAKSLKEHYANTLRIIEEHRVHEGNPSYGAEDLAKKFQELTDAELEKARTERAVASKKAEIAALESEVAAAESKLKAATKDLELARKKLQSLAPSDVQGKVANLIRDAPGLDFIGPSLKVRKVVLENLTNNLNFTVKSRIDMCHTCHMAIDREGFEDEPQPFTTHPDLDLYLSAKSPHPLNDVGCTICHQGCGEALDFIRADHRPMADADDPVGTGQWAEWEEKHHWHKQHHWDWPMLTREYIESSCVQCHTDSMELIAEDAPQVSEGYRLFERYGCYSCHKVEWLPTTRRPGPSLARWKSKLDVDWIASWVANPKAFRPTTWMPQIFHLENFAPDEVIAVSDFGRGREIKGQEWNDSAVASIVAFLDERVPATELPEIPLEGDAERGREVFRVSGCLACHNLAPYEGEEPRTEDPAFERAGENEHGPNLRGVATKIDARWLYSWILDPQAYWNETHMPDLRLSEQDAADITAYVMGDPDGVFTDVPDGWQVAPSPSDPEVLREQARWFFKRLGEDELDARFAGESPEHRWDDPRALMVAVGEKFVLHQGCYSCHEIPGLESVMPIGTELTNWASKTVDKLDWGFVADLMQKEHGWSLNEREEFKHYREGWLEQKLHEPRSFDRDKVKLPLDRLRMPYFAFTGEQVKAISTFVLGLRDDEVQLARMRPDAVQASMNAGLQTIRQKNCAACHVVEPGSVTFEHEGQTVTVHAELQPFSAEDKLPPKQSDLAGLQAEIASWEEATEEELEEVGFRLLEVEPTVGLPGQTIFVEPDAIVAVTPPWGGDFVRTVTDYYFFGIAMFDPEAAEDEAIYGWNLGEEGEVEDVDGKLRPYFDEQYDKIRWTFAPPVLIDEGYKLQRDWFYAFLRDPVALRRQMRVRMPSFHFAPGEAEAVADYFAYHSEIDWPRRYAKTLRYAEGMETKVQFQDPAIPWPEASTMRSGGDGLTIDELVAIANETPAAAGLTAAAVRGIERGYGPDIVASFPKVMSLGSALGFDLNAPVVRGSDLIQRRAPSHVTARGPFVEIGATLATDAAAVNCYQCHWHGGEPPAQVDSPLAWGPDLALTRERLREDWTEDWLWNPALIYPGTSMPGNFQNEPPQYQAFYPNSTNRDQIQSVLDWLYNYDRWPVATQ